MIKSSLEAYSEQLARETKRRAIQEELNKRAIETAVELLSQNVPMEQIAEITGLDVEDIQKLVSEP
jgi:predicted transposase YdaD